VLDSSCKYGLIEGDETRGNMWYHHGDVYVYQGVRHTRDHSCLHCGHDLPGTHWSEWPRWTGEFVLGVDPPVGALLIGAVTAVATATVVYS